jgi:hypothetical protein
MYIIFALLLLILYCMMYHTRRYSDLEGFFYKTYHHGAPTAGDARAKAFWDQRQREQHPDQ